ncbi:MAG: redoxin domain-containing protein [Pseudomonadota bacterium]
MSFLERGARWMLPMLLALGLTACTVEDDLLPSDEDRRPDVVAGTVGVQPGQIAPDFTLPDTGGADFTLSEHLAGGAQPADAIVLYFTMWCPVCLGHTDHLLNELVPRFAGRGTVVYGLVDYVSGSVENARAMEQSNGYAGSAFAVLIDADLQVFDTYRGAMGKIVVIGPDGVIQLNEDYRTGNNTAVALDRLLP